MVLKDASGRTIDYIRVSVMDRCNLRCIYCMPGGDKKQKKPSCARPEELLGLPKLLEFIGVALEYGLKKVRLTGGEPLLRGDIVEMVSALKTIGVPDLSLSTNGLLLAPLAVSLKRAGLDRVNVSLDSLTPKTYEKITGKRSLGKALEAIEIARAEGLSPVKINVVPVKGVNDSEVLSFARLTLERPYHVRFIELMPLKRPGRAVTWAEDKRITSEEIFKAISALGRLVPVNGPHRGASRNYRLEGASGIIGFISPMSNHFCHACNRLRLTARGGIRSCLFSDAELSIGAARSRRQMEELLVRAVRLKPAQRPDGAGIPVESMSSIGG